MKAIGVVIIGIVLLLGGYFIYQQMSSNTTNLGSQLGVFSGALPCADCEQLKTTLTLNQDSNTSAPSSYKLEQIYVGKNVPPIVKTGRWAIQKGYPQNPNATVYVLNSDQQKSRQLYVLKVNDNQLQLLNQDQGKITSLLNFSLTRQK